MQNRAAQPSFIKPKGSRVGFGALFISYYEKKLKYAGKLGTGYDTIILKTLDNRLKQIEQKTSPFKDEIVKEKDVYFVELKLVAQVSFTEWTKDGKLRYPTFLSLRDDKSVINIKREL
ncbi:hypothetical protein COB11_00630 [Candidatus Aerophobetes bacterium]|uniref:DNA ligase (ATP) n=1 Tax=Aerophobetes bacterium TaxID=2030807 RepID=A0A2A4YNZ1_UNCAE|nr:MAG: hypothetical protein COB11_00630 [Candidatus Aerophobetes bacterium]